MLANIKTRMKDKINNTQDLIYIGYIFLIGLGIIHESLFYSQIGINILEYSDILDVLISPVSRLNSNLTLLSISIFFIILVTSFPRMYQMFKSHKWFEKIFKLKNTGKQEDTSKKIQQVLVIFTAIFFVGIFVGSGLKRGIRLKTKIKEGKIQYDQKIKFNDGTEIKSKIIGKNSSYIFYLTKDNKGVKISPISGTIKHISINK